MKDIRNNIKILSRLSLQCNAIFYYCSIVLAFFLYKKIWVRLMQIVFLDSEYRKYRWSIWGGVPNLSALNMTFIYRFFFFWFFMYRRFHLCFEQYSDENTVIKICHLLERLRTTISLTLN